MTQHTIDGPLPGVRFVVDEDGDPNGVPVVWLHGVFGALGEVPFADQLTGVRLISVHHLGFGVSEGVERFYDIRDLALAYWWLLDDLGLDKVVLVGHSFGGTVAAELAVQQPQRVSGVVLAAPFGLFRAEQPGLDVFGTIPRDLIGALYVDPTGDLATGHFPVVDDAHGRGLQAVYRAQVLSSASRFLFPIPDTGISERLYRIADVPVHLVWGAADGVTPVELLEDWHAVLPHADTTVVATAAHMVPYETPEAIAAAITGQL